MPLVMFGGYVKPGIDSRWCSHVSVPKTVLQLLGVAKIGVPRVDNDPRARRPSRHDKDTDPPPPGFKNSISLPAAQHN
jgi:hypothetical protein